MAGAALVWGLAALPASAVDLYVMTQGNGNPVLPMQRAPGSSVTFALNGSTPTGTNRWYHNDQLIPGATGLTLTVSNLASADSGNYELTVTTADGTVHQSNTVTINVLPFPPSPVDLTFTSQLPPSTYYPTVSFAMPDESLIVQMYDGTSSPPVVRLNPDGSRTAGYSVPSSAGNLLAALADGELITSQAPYRLNVDSSPRPLTLPAAFDATKPLTAACAQPDGKLLIAQNRLVARLNADDSLDPTFTYSSTLSSQHAVTGLQLDATGRIYAKASEYDPVAGHFPSSWTEMYRLASTGAEDPTFQHQLPPLRRGGIALYPFADGRLLRYQSYEGIVYWAMLQDNGVADPAWSANGGTPTSVAVDPAHNRIFTLSSSSGYVIRRVLITATGLADDPSFYPGSGSPATLAVTPSGKLLVTGSFYDWDGHATSLIARLRPDDVVTSFPPSVSIAPGDVTPSRGATQVFTSAVTGTGPFTYQWLALDGQPLPADTTSPTLTITNFSLAHFGRYQLRVTSPLGSVLSYVTRAILNPADPPYLAALSGRAYVGTGENVAIAGLTAKVYSGALGVPTLLRGAGPALQPYGVTGFMPNPVLNLFNVSSQLLANNDNWRGASDLVTAAATCGAFPFSADSNDSALQYTFYSGNYTLQLGDQGNANGVGLVEVYRVPNSLVSGELLNLSFRARTEPGERTAIAGLVIVDPQNFDRTARVLIRVVGPTLARYGVTTPLADPVLTVYDANGRVVARNDNWTDDPLQVVPLTSAMSTVGAFGLPDPGKDAAVLLDLPAGVYTVHATSADNASSGVVLTEIYLVK